MLNPKPSKNSVLEEIARRQARIVYADDSVLYTNSKTVITYAKHGDKQVQMILEPATTNIIIRMKFDEGVAQPIDHKLAVEFLRSEVTRLSAASEPIKLGKTGVQFQFRGGFPFWAPYYESCESEGAFDAIQFAKGEMEQGVVMADGQPARSGHYASMQRPTGN